MEVDGRTNGPTRNVLQSYHCHILKRVLKTKVLQFDILSVSIQRRKFHHIQILKLRSSNLISAELKTLRTCNKLKFENDIGE